MIHWSWFRHRLDRDVVFGLVALALGLSGLLDIRFGGGWRAGPGVGNYLVPGAAFVVLAASGASVLAGRLVAGSRAAPPEPVLAPILFALATAVWGIGFFAAVRHVGLAVGSFAFILIAVALLAPHGRKVLHIVGVALLTALLFWILFTTLAPIISRPILF